MHNFRRGFTVVDLTAIVVAMGLIGACGITALAGNSSQNRLAVSLNNLRGMNLAMADYAATYNDRQPSVAVDNLAGYGSDSATAVTNYFLQTGLEHPGIVLGNCDFSTWGYWMPGFGGGTAANGMLLQPIDFSNRFGFFRMPATRPLNGFLNGRFYDEVFYAPADTTAYSVAEPYFDHSCEYVPIAAFSGLPWSSYIFSPAALFDPQVLRSNAAGGYRDPWTFATSLNSPTVSQWAFPTLKTRMSEHYWNQNPPADRCNPAFTSGSYLGCTPYFFNGALPSEPATLFFDGSIRTLPLSEAVGADQAVLNQTSNVDGLWHRGTPLGQFGYYGAQSFDGTNASHHILTTDGILGRDTLSGGKP